MVCLLPAASFGLLCRGWHASGGRTLPERQSDRSLHRYEVEPAVELVGHFGKEADSLETELFMQVKRCERGGVDVPDHHVHAELCSRREQGFDEHAPVA